MEAGGVEAILVAVKEKEVQVQVLRYDQVNHDCPRMKCCHGHPRAVANQCCPQIADAVAAWEGRPPLKLNLQAMQGRHMCQSQMDDARGM